MNTLVGFVTISKNATTCKGALNPNEFIGKNCPVMEFGVDDCVLVFRHRSVERAEAEEEILCAHSAVFSRCRRRRFRKRSEDPTRH